MPRLVTHHGTADSHGWQVEGVEPLTLPSGEAHQWPEQWAAYAERTGSGISELEFLDSADRDAFVEELGL